MKKLLPLLLFLSAAAIAQQPGTIDVQYGPDHTGTTVIVNKIVVQATAVQADDKLLLGGYDATDYSFSLFRQNKDGSVDASFGNNGRVLLEVKDLVKDFMFDLGWYALAIQADGKIVAAGTTTHYNLAVQGEWGGPWDNDIVLARFFPDGSLDSSFGNKGRLVTNLGLIENATSVKIQKDGKIIVAGYQDRDSDGDGTVAMLVRYNSDGILDTAFGGGAGYVRYTAENSSIYDVLVQPDEKIIGGGGYYANSNFFLIRFLADGTLDKSFGDNGTTVTDFHVGLLGTHISGIAMDKEGRIIAAGASRYYDDGRVVRYQPDGKQDKTFMNNGKILFNIAGFDNIYPNTITAMPNNKFLISGAVWNNRDTLHTVFLASMNDDGSLDSSFGTSNGYTLTPPGTSVAQQVSTKLLSDGKIVTTYYQYEQNNVLTTRYNGYPASAPMYVRIKHWLQTHGISWSSLPANDNIACYYVQQSSNATNGFKDIAKVSATAHLRNYSISNTALLQGTNYYRIKAISKEGAVYYSEVVSADNSALLASVYPNPARNYIVVKGLASDKTSHISIASAAGVVKMNSISTGAAQQRLYIGNLQRGTYYVYITASQHTDRLTFVKAE